MTVEDWVTAYILRFGYRQIHIMDNVEGEDEFFMAMARALRLPRAEDRHEFDHPVSPATMAVRLLRRGIEVRMAKQTTLSCARQMGGG